MLLLKMRLLCFKAEENLHPLSPEKTAWACSKSRRKAFPSSGKRPALMIELLGRERGSKDQLPQMERVPRRWTGL